MQPSAIGSPAATDTRELSRQVGAFFLYLANASNRDFLPETSELELSLTQLKALFLIGARTEEPLSMKSLAEGLGLSFAATSRAVDALCKRGLMDRDEDPDDRRVKRVSLAPKGRRAVDRLTAIRLASLERLVETFSPDERKKLAEALEPILARDEIRRFLPRRSTR
jgi:DNA-binding MarR family transcriptional regulator